MSRKKNNLRSLSLSKSSSNLSSKLWRQLSISSQNTRQIFCLQPLLMVENLTSLLISNISRPSEIKLSVSSPAEVTSHLRTSPSSPLSNWSRRKLTRVATAASYQVVALADHAKTAVACALREETQLHPTYIAHLKGKTRWFNRQKSSLRWECCLEVTRSASNWTLRAWLSRIKSLIMDPILALIDRHLQALSSQHISSRRSHTSHLEASRTSLRRDTAFLQSAEIELKVQSKSQLLLTATSKNRPSIKVHWMPTSKKQLLVDHEHLSSLLNLCRKRIWATLWPRRLDWRIKLCDLSSSTTTLALTCIKRTHQALCLHNQQHLQRLQTANSNILHLDLVICHSTKRRQPLWPDQTSMLAWVRLQRRWRPSHPSGLTLQTTL